MSNQRATIIQFSLTYIIKDYVEGRIPNKFLLRNYTTT